MQLALPAVPEAWDLTRFDMTVYCWSEVQLSRLENRLELSETNGNGRRAFDRVVEPREWFDQTGVVDVTAGFHESDSEGEAGTGRFSFLGEWTWPRKRPQVDSEDLGSLIEVAAEIGRIPFQVSANWVLPSDKPVFAVDLPIRVEIDELPEIRGVRLAKRDPDNPERDLYTVILNEHGSTSVISVSALFETVLKDDIFSVAWERVLAIADFAVTLPGGDDD